MKRKLRKSLSWLLTFAMVVSLFCGMIPSASAVDDTVLDLGEIGSIDYQKGELETDVEIYLNYVHQKTFKDVMIFDSRWDSPENFVLQLNEGYVFDSIKATDNFIAESTTPLMSITYPAPYKHLDYSLPVIGENGHHTIKLYFFNFESTDGVTINFDRVVDNVSVSGVWHPDACTSVNVSYQYKGETYSYEWDRLSGTQQMLVPLGTMVYVEPNIDYSRYTFEEWSTAVDCPLYTIDQNGQETQTGTNANSAYMAFNSTPTTGDGRIIRLTMKSTPQTFTVSYNANEGTGTMQSQTFHNDGVTISENAFTAPTGKVFDSWNTKKDGSGKTYNPGDPYGDGVNEKWDLTLYAQWKDEETTPPTPGGDYAITGFTKELVTGGKPKGVTIPEGVTVTYPEVADDIVKPVEVPVNGFVTLMYQFTVEGKEGTFFTIKDTGATAVGGDYVSSSTEGSIVGTIPETGTATVYVIKTFTVADIENNQLSNKASISVNGEEGSIAEGEDKAEETVPAEKGAPLPPTDENIKDLINTAYGNGLVTIHCTTAETSSNHEDKTYGLLDGYTVGTVYGKDGAYSVDVTVVPGPYVTKYGQEEEINKTHNLNPGQTVKTVVLDWTAEGGWVVDEEASDVPVTYTVTCDDGHTTVVDIEYHIMGLDTIKQAVVDNLGAEASADDIGIYAIYVHGTDGNGHANTATGGMSTDLIYEDVLGSDRDPDEGAVLLGNFYASGDYWHVENTFAPVNNDTITGITIYYKNGNTEDNVTIPCTEFEARHLEGIGKTHITEIYLDVTTPDDPDVPPVTETYTLTIKVENGTVTNNNSNVALQNGVATITLTEKPSTNKLVFTAANGYGLASVTENDKAVNLNEQQLGSNSYSRQATISNDYTIKVVFVPNKPAYDDLKTLLGEIKVKCDTDLLTHGEKGYDLIANTPGQEDNYKVEVYADNTCKVTVFYAPYVDLYSGNQGVDKEHVLVAGSVKQFTVELKWENGKWAVVDGQTPIIISVKCSSAPETIDHSTLAGLFDVAVTCTNSEVSHGTKTYDLKEGTYTCTVNQLAGTAQLVVESNEYVTQFNDPDTGVAPGHSTVDPQTVTLTWDPVKNQWYTTASYTIEFKVTCTDDGSGSGDPSKYVITATAKENGSISPAGQVPVEAGEQQNFTFIPANGYAVDTVYTSNGTFVNNGTGQLSSWKGYTFMNVVKDGYITVTFAKDDDNDDIPDKYKQYTVTFNSNGGSAVAPQTVVNGEKATKPVDPTRTNYRFNGWYLGNTKYSFDTPVTSDITLKASWTRIVDDDDRPNTGSGNESSSDPTGNLRISLDVNGDNEEFTFTVILTDEDGDDLKNNFYYNGDFTGTIGSGDDITLAGGEEIVIRNLPVGTRYEVIIETADGYTYVIDGDEGVIRRGTSEAEFTATQVVALADPSVTGVSRWLNVTDHIAYLTGYPTGGFGPDNSMTRAEVAQMFYALLNNKNVTITKTFPDVPSGAWYATAVNTLASLGMVSGDENGNYRPDAPITRAEFCAIALAFAYEPENAVCYFTDVARGDWFYPYVAQAASYGWIGGYTDGSFGPNQQITRAQVTTIVNNMLGRVADRDYVIDHQNTLVQFNDLTRAHWAYFQIMEATNAHDYTKSNGTENWR